MKLQTTVDIDIARGKLSYQSGIMMLGSCFSANIGRRLEERKFDVTYNPLGTIYNPLSVVKSLELLESGRAIDACEMFYHNEQWGHFAFSTDFSSCDKEVALDAANSALQRGAGSLKRCDTLIITLGTAYSYSLVSTGETVANCHKFRSDNFDRRLLSVDVIVDALSEVLSRSFYRDKRVIFTVSPIRHLRDGLVENSVSKAHLLVAVAELRARFDNVEYFPAYEIFLDELRDYRFYDVDMVHPSQSGVEYVWERFRDVAFSQECKEHMQRVEGVVRDFNHRAKNPDSDAYRRFVSATIEKALAIEREVVGVDFSGEIDRLK